MCIHAYGEKCFVKPSKAMHKNINSTFHFRSSVVDIGVPIVLVDSLQVSAGAHLQADGYISMTKSS